VRLTNHVTTLNFSRRQAATPTWGEMDMLVSFIDEDGEVKDGVIVDYLDEGVFLVKTSDGKEHNVSDEDFVTHSSNPF